MSTRLRANALTTTSFSRRSEALDRDFDFEPGNLYRAVSETDTGQRLMELIASEGIALILIGAVYAAPSRPPVAALTPFIQTHIGEEAFEDSYKRFTGRCVRQVMEHLGAKFRRSNVPISAKGSAYRSGAVYTFRTLEVA